MFEVININEKENKRLQEQQIVNIFNMKMAESNILQVCRACLAENVSFQSIFTSDEKSDLRIHFAEMIMACASVQVKKQCLIAVNRIFETNPIFYR